MKTKITEGVTYTCSDTRIHKAFQTRAMLDKFPEISEGERPLLSKSCGIDSFKIGGITPELLSKTGHIDEAVGSLVGIDDRKTYHVVKHSGHPLDVKPARDVVNNYAHCDNYSEDGETVGSALMRASTHNVKYICLIESGYEIVAHHSVGGLDVTVYLPSKKFNLHKWKEEQEEAAKRSVQEMCEMSQK